MAVGVGGGIIIFLEKEYFAWEREGWGGLKGSLPLFLSLAPCLSPPFSFFLLPPRSLAIGLWRSLGPFQAPVPCTGSTTLVLCCSDGGAVLLVLCATTPRLP